MHKTTLIFSLFIFTSALNAQEALKLRIVEQNIVQKINAKRIQYGRSPLVIDFKLMRSARAHCRWMARNNNLRHTTLPVYENIACGQSSSTEVVNDWMRSSGHRENILNIRLKRTGVAAFRARNGRIYWAQQFKR